MLNNYLVWRMAHRYVQDLGWDYVHANREIYVDMTGVAEFLGTWKYCVRKIDTDMNEALSALFVKDHFSDANKRAAHEITNYIKKAMSESLKSTFHWMSPDTRLLAQKKHYPTVTTREKTCVCFVVAHVFMQVLFLLFFQIDLSGIGIPYGYFVGTNDEYLKELTDYKKFMRTVGGYLLRDAKLNITAAEKNYRLETFVNDAFMVESQLAGFKSIAEATQNPHASDKRLTLTDLNNLSGGAIDWVKLFTYMFDMSPVNRNTYVVVLEQDYITKVTNWLNNMDSGNKSRMLNNYLVWRIA
ncbi:uncharacterized protein [Littorina saxatilis]|uniref:uncharacterized protein n=1 Tax=Littorina saxatilis TaxID=31220 RepID=UPI0038B62220